MLKKIIKTFLFAGMLLAGMSIYIHNRIPDVMYFSPGQEVSIKSLPTVVLTKAQKPSPEVSAVGGSVKYTASLFGIFPVKTVAVATTDRLYVSVSGEPFGIKMFCDGVMVVGFSDILTATGYQNPAKLVGLKMGDVILEINGHQTQTNEDVEGIIKKHGQNPVTVTYLRDEVRSTLTLVAVFDVNNNTYRTGMWVRDSSAGIGTMTFYDINRGLFAGLGHGIKDVDTQKEIRLLSGEIVPVKITGVLKSHDGTAGELKGTFMTTIASGKVLLNKDTGVYGDSYGCSGSELMAVASPQEVQTGKAYILTTINGTKPQKYEIEIEKVSLTSQNQNKNMVIRITDPSLLALTGGIVQGMSGSPIIQNGKLVGAITHVFVNQVNRGYGIFAQNMITTMNSIEYLELKNAS
ncbi:MAG: SpoIVB peptidase [Oscillospiraceae bacterium]